MKGTICSIVFCLVLILTLAQYALPQTANSYQQTNLVSDIPGTAAQTDPNLVNPWGISFFPGQPFWIADNGSGFSTIYDGNGVTQLQAVKVPAAGGATTAAPITGTVANPTSDFAIRAVPSLFLFVSEDGAISGWGGGAAAAIAVDNSAAGAVYKGLAIGSNANGNFLFATNFSQGKVDVFDRNFNPATLAGTFADPNLPAGYAPFGIQNIGNNQLVVTYALQDNTKTGDVSGAGHGFVDLFDTGGHLLKRIASQGTLNSPWGIAVAPASFGAFGGALLIGNFGDGLTNAFDMTAPTFLGQLNGTNGQPLFIDGLWALAFGGGGLSGDASSLYFTAGLNGETHGLFGKLVAAASTTTSDFSVAPAQSSLTVMRGGSNSVLIDVTGSGGFNSAVSLACSGLPAQTTCSFSPPSVTAGSTAATSTLTITIGSSYTAANFPHPGSSRMVMLSLLGMGGIGGFCFVGPLRRRAKATAFGAVLFVLLAMVLLQTACGGSSGGSRTTTGGGTPAGNAFTTVVTATSGGLSHSTNISVTVQ